MHAHCAHHDFVNVAIHLSCIQLLDLVMSFNCHYDVIVSYLLHHDTKNYALRMDVHCFWLFIQILYWGSINS